MADAPSLRIIFAGTPVFAAEHLQALIDQQQHDIVAVYTQPDRPSGRGKKLLPTPVKQVALSNGIQVQQVLNFKSDDSRQQLASYNADIMVVAAYGLLLPQAVLDTPRLGCINVHASLLPRWRGAAPIERSIEANDTCTGITIMQMALGLDTGDMLLKATCDIASDETGGSLHDKLIQVGKPLLLEALSQLASNSISAEKQDDSQSCYAKKLNKHEGLIKWQASATTIERTLRAFTPSIKSYSFLNTQRVGIVAALADDNADNQAVAAGTILDINKHFIVVACGKGLLQISELQLPNAKSMGVAALLNGRPDFFNLGDQFSDAQ